MGICLEKRLQVNIVYERVVLDEGCLYI
jgi:hypothetical protein